MSEKQFNSLDRYKEFIESIPDIVCLTDKNNIIVDCNERLLSQNGCEKKDIIGRLGYDFLTKESQEKVHNHSLEIMKKGKIENLSVDAIKKDGTIYKALTTISLILDENRDFQGAICVIKDITELYQTKIELEKQREKNLSILGTLSSKMAHDIRNPLSIISVTLENIKMKFVPTELQQSQFDKVDRAIFRITHQIDDVLDFVNIQPLIVNKIKISDIISDALDSLFIPNNIILKLPKNDVDLNCDARKLSVVFVNLVFNGIQAVNNNGIIEIKLKENAEDIVIQIQDSGEGISKENIKKIFVPLFTTKQSGTGLGLASVKSIIESHGGTISVTSPPTIFTITLPKTLEKTDN